MIADRDVPHLFAAFFQIRRAFHYIFRNIVGDSAPVVRLRAAVWQSIFTRDMRRYRRSLYHRMGDVATLISGPSGTGKELVARAIGLARYIPFDADQGAFVESFAGSFYALNLSALSPTLIESELFGHRRGAFTGAVEDRAGLARGVPAARHRVPRRDRRARSRAPGEAAARAADAHVPAARGDARPAVRRQDHRRHQPRPRPRDAGRALPRGPLLPALLRPDRHARRSTSSCATPPASAGRWSASSPRRVAGDAEAESLADETEAWIDAHLGPGYRWPGNVRELEQCVRNVMIRGEYRPPQRR